MPQNAIAGSRVPMAEEQPPSNRPANCAALTMRFAHEEALRLTVDRFVQNRESAAPRYGLGYVRADPRAL
jgi:hypothetical protein